MNQVRFTLALLTDCHAKCQAWSADPEIEHIVTQTSQLLERGVAPERLMDSEMKLGDDASCCRMAYTAFARLTVVQLLAVGSNVWKTVMAGTPQQQFEEADLENNLERLNALIQEALNADEFLKEKVSPAIPYVSLRRPADRLEQATTLEEVSQEETKMIDAFKAIKVVVQALKRSQKACCKRRFLNPTPKSVEIGLCSTFNFQPE